MSNNESGRRKVGRPKDSGHRGQQIYSGKCDVRLSKQEDMELTRLAEKYGTTRSEVMRKALDDLIRFNTEG